MIGTLRSVVLDCPDMDVLATFYRELLGLEEDWRDDDWITLTAPDGGVRVCLQLAPDHVPPRWPDPAFPQQVHLDVMVDDLDTAEAAALAIGATKLPTPPDAGDFRVYADPAGHPFCFVVVKDKLDG